ncbi:MAG: hypothetical protein A2901_06050 [Elusimicrobia bacterium RIFCSPLOWO2_01_FULL_54_10]|nr:MAG: hypothetical protein A2901_06050 [Elusimicrobia bacterium RIFCSPLOWO2_01_FULL_54_10]
MKALPRKFYCREALDIARELIGLHLVHLSNGKRKAGRIVETEAYKGPQDLASHASRGLTPRTKTMFGPPGRAYIYLIYGFWNCFNVVVREEGVPHAVLVRAVEPVQGITDKTWGPGLLCKAMGIGRDLNGEDLCGTRLWIEKPKIFKKSTIARATRIGVDYAKHWARKPWRFFDASSPYVSTTTASLRFQALKK